MLRISVPSCAVVFRACNDVKERGIVCVQVEHPEPRSHEILGTDGLSVRPTRILSDGKAVHLFVGRTLPGLGKRSHRLERLRIVGKQAFIERCMNLCLVRKKCLLRIEFRQLCAVHRDEFRFLRRKWRQDDGYREDSQRKS